MQQIQASAAAAAASFGGGGASSPNFGVTSLSAAAASTTPPASPAVGVVGSNTAAPANFVFPRKAPETGGLFAVIDAVTQSRDYSATFWKPDPTKGEKGLLQALVSRHCPNYAGGGADSDFLPLNARCDMELANNFSNAANDRVDLSHSRFKLSRATQAVSHLNRAAQAADAGAYVAMADVRDGLRDGIAQLQTDEYFLVKYRDYSDFATTRWHAEARRDRVLSPLFVERFFAVRVGSQHGVFIPISEAQFDRGNERLHAANLSPESVAKGRVQISLDTDQFKSLGTPSSEFNPNMRQPGDQQRSGDGGDDADLDLPPAPHAFDWSAQACNIRWRRFTRKHYHNVGRYTLKMALIGAAAFYIKYRFFPSQPAGAITNGSSSGGRGGGKKGAARSNGQIIRDILSLPVTVIGSALMKGRGDDDD